MTFLLLENPNERLHLTIKLLKFYIDNIINIDEIHFLLDILINDTRNKDEDLFNLNFLNIIGEFVHDYINKYNNLPVDDIDIDSSNYVLKDEFDLAVRKLYKDLLKIK